MALTMLFHVVAGALYLAFAGAAGTLLRLAGVGSSRNQARALGGLQAVLIWLPTTLLILALPPVPLSLRVGLLTLGLAALLLCAFRPGWVPPRLWAPRFAYNYFALGMGLCVVWEIGVMLTSFSLLPAIMAAAAGTAGLASLDRAMRPA